MPVDMQLDEETLIQRSIVASRAEEGDASGVLAVIRIFVHDMREHGRVLDESTLPALADILGKVADLDLADRPELRKGDVAIAMGLSKGWPGRNAQRDFDIRGLFGLMTAEIPGARKPKSPVAELAERFDIDPSLLRRILKMRDWK